MKSFKDYIDKNKFVLEKALQIDNKKWNEQLGIEEILKQEDLDIKLEKDKIYLVIYEGDPIVTKILLEKAIKVSANIIFTLDDYYLATNTIFVGIANKLLEENDLKNLFKIYNNIKEDKIFENTKEVDTTIFIGNKEDFAYIEAHVKGDLIKIEYI